MRRSPSAAARAQSIAIVITGLSSFAWLPGAGVYYPRFGLTLLAGAAWLCVWAYGGLQRLDRRRRPFFLGLSIAIAAVVASSLLSRFPDLAVSYGGATGVSGAYWLALICVMGAATRVTLSHATSHVVKWQFAWALPIAAIGLVQAIATGHVTVAYENVDLFAPMMLLFAPLALGFAVAESRPRLRGAWVGAAALFVAAVLATRTMAGFVGLAAEVLIAAWLAPGLLGMRRGSTARRWIIGVLSAGALVFMLVGTLYVTDSLPPQGEGLASDTFFGRSAVTRVEMWKAAVQEIRTHPWFGVGPDQYAFEGQKYFSHNLYLTEHYPDPDQELPLDPHSLLVLLFVDFGLLGLAALLVISWSWARDVFGGTFATDRGRLVRWSYAVSALGFGYAALFVPFPLVYGAFPVFIAGLALVGPSTEETSERIALANPRWAAALFAVILAAYLGFHSVAAWVEFSAPTTGTGGALDQASRAQAHQPQVAFYRFVSLWQEGRLLARSSEPEGFRRYQASVDAAPFGVREYAPYLVELVRLSLDDAMRTGRTDVTWERARLVHAAALSPSLPELDAEVLHLELAAGDLDAARRAALVTEKWRDVVPEVPVYERMLREAEAGN